jgi:uncharacterized protein (UPF0332 family)
MENGFLSKAKENLRIARMSFDAECYNACANRAYYAAFQAAIAALADRGAARGKNDHKWVQSEFNRMLIKGQKVYPARVKSYLLNMQRVRDKADYSEKNVGKKAAQKQLSQSAELIQIIEKELGK